MKLITLALFVVSAILFNACTITQEISFNPDYSGDIALVIDLTEVAAMDESGTMMKDFQDSLGNEMVNDPNLNSKGVTVAGYEIDTSNFLIKVKYQFKDIDGLNYYLSKQANELAMDSTKTEVEFHKFFVKKGKKLIYTEKRGTAEKEAGELDDMFVFKTVVNLPGKGSSLKGKDVTLDGNKLEWSRRMGDMNAFPKPFTFSVKVK